MSKKLYKSRTNIKIDGVCSGVANFFGIDVTIVRIIWVIFALFAGQGLLIYILCMFIVPREPEMMEYTDSDRYKQ